MSALPLPGEPPGGGHTRPRVLHIDDDEKYCRFVNDYLGRHGYAVTSVSDGTQGLQRLLAEPWELVMLDVMLPDIDGFKLLRKIRQASQVPVLMLTARGDELDRIDGLDFGADDYVPKIFSQRELLARIAAVLRRLRPGEGRPSDELVVGRLRIRPSAHRVFLNEEEIQLTPLEFAILVSLARSKGRGKSRIDLVNEISDHRHLHSRLIDVHIFSLRKKLGEGPEASRYIRTVRNVGYMLVDPDSPF